MTLALTAGAIMASAIFLPLYRIRKVARKEADLQLDRIKREAK